MDRQAHALDHESRAHWHLELLGCFEPADAVAPWIPPASEPPDDGWDEEDDDFACTHCGGQAFREVDDIWWDDCDEFGWGPCTSCHGTGLRSRQWVF